MLLKAALCHLDFSQAASFQAASREGEEVLSEVGLRTISCAVKGLWEGQKWTLDRGVAA